MLGEYIAELGLNAAKDYFTDRIDENKLRSALTEYIEHQRKYTEVASLAEEFDFQGLVEYIQDDLLKDVEIRVFNSSQKKRGEARQHIVDIEPLPILWTIYES